MLENFSWNRKRRHLKSCWKIVAKVWPAQRMGFEATFSRNEISSSAWSLEGGDWAVPMNMQENF